MACETCKTIKEKAVALWAKTKEFMVKKTLGMPNWLVWVVFPVVLIGGAVYFLAPKKKHN